MRGFFKVFQFNSTRFDSSGFESNKASNRIRFHEGIPRRPWQPSTPSLSCSSSPRSVLWMHLFNGIQVGFKLFRPFSREFWKSLKEFPRKVFHLRNSPAPQHPADAGRSKKEPRPRIAWDTARLGDAHCQEPLFNACRFNELNANLMKLK